MPPALILINGLYAAGKTTLSHWLAEELRAPLFSKDQFKERLYELDPPLDRDHSRRLGITAYDLAFAAVESVLAAGQIAILEGPLRPEFEQDRVDAIVTRHAAAPIQLFLDADRDLLVQRYLARRGEEGRHPAHQVGFDEAALVAAVHEGWSPLELAHTLTVETTDFGVVDRPFILDWVRGRLATASGAPL